MNLPMSVRRLGRVILASCLVLVGQVEAAEPDLRLMTAARTQDLAAVRALLDEGVDVNAARVDGVTALLWAAHWDDLEIARLLLQGGADADAAEDQGVTPLLRACENRSVAMVSALLGPGPPSAPARPGRPRR